MKYRNEDCHLLTLERNKNKHDYRFHVNFAIFSCLPLTAPPPASSNVHTSQGMPGSQHKSDPLLPECVQHSPASPCGSTGQLRSRSLHLLSYLLHFSGTVTSVHFSCFDLHSSLTLMHLMDVATTFPKLDF